MRINSTLSHYVIRHCALVIALLLLPLGVYAKDSSQTLNVNIQNLFTPSGWIGDGEYGREYISFSGANTDRPHSPPRSIKISYKFGPKSWGGIYWQNQPDNWGDRPGNNYADSRFSKITFWARGETGGEVVEFKSGGIDSSVKKYRDSYVATIGRVSLSREWKQYQIPLFGADLSSVIGAFCWVASADYNNSKSIMFYLDDIVLEANSENVQSTPGSAVNAYERFREFGKEQQWSRMYEMLSEDTRADMGKQLSTVLSIVSLPQSEREALREAGDFAMFAWFMKHAEFDNIVVLSNSENGGHAMLQVLAVALRDIQILDVELELINDEWKFTSIWGMRDPLELPSAPTVSPRKVYEAFLTFRNRGDWASAIEFIDQESLNNVAKAVRLMLASQAPDVKSRDKIIAMDNRLLMIMVFSSQPKENIHGIEIVRETVQGNSAIIETRQSKNGDSISDSPVHMRWKSGMWRMVLN